MVHQTTLIDSPSTPQQPIRPIRQDLVDGLVAYKRENEISDSSLAKLIGTNGSAVNRAINGKFIGDVKAFEGLVEDFLRNEPLRRRVRETLFIHGFAVNVRSFLEVIRRTNDVGLGFSAAGKGKTCGVALYLADNPSAIGLDLTRWSGGSRGIARLLLEQIGVRASLKKNIVITDFLVSKLKDSNRLIIIDNAHRLSSSGRQWVFDFHDATGCPIALVGNPEVLDEIRRNDQQFSRIGFVLEIQSGKDATSVANNMVRRHWPEAEGKLGGMPLQVLKGPGHLRSLRKQLLLARDFSQVGEFADPTTAFRAAHEKLVRDYQLEDEA